MSSRNQSDIPFVGLHAHSVAGSPFDALGYPPDHMDFAYNNGMDALALTDHGNMNGLAWQVLHAKKMKASGKEFKPIFGCEAYFIPSVEKWKKEYEDIKAASKKKSDYEADNSGTTVEDEGASKKKIKSVLNRRRHLILLAMNQTGLQNIFKMISRSYSGDNFYRYPRVDYALLKKHNEGVIAASACLGGVYAGNYWENRDVGPDAVLGEMRKMLAVDMALATESIKDAVKDGKTQIDEANSQLENVVSENVKLKEELTNIKSEALLEKMSQNLPEVKKNYVKKVLGNKDEQFITENFDYTVELFDKEAQRREEELATEATKDVQGKVDPVIEEQTDVIESPIEEEKPAPLFNTYMGELGKY